MDSMIVLERDVAIPVGQDLVLRADVYRRSDDHPRPSLLQYTAYNKSNWASVNGVIAPTRAVESGFNVVVVDALGRFASDGQDPYRPFFSDGPSAAACVEWVAAQVWCTGAVGMYGASNNGVPQWQAARVGAPSLKTIVPHFTASEFDQGWVYRGGAFQLGFNLWWSLANLAPDMVRRGIEGGAMASDIERQLMDALRDPTPLFEVIPLEAVAPLAEIAPHYNEWIAHPPGDPYWAEASLKTRWSAVSIPVLHIAGWYNVHLDGNLANFIAMRENAPETVRNLQYLVIGPWTQWSPGLLGGSCGPERRFPATLDVEGLQLEWFAHYLADGPAPDLPRVKAFLMGTDEWVDIEDWPPPTARETTYFLHSGGRANSLTGDGSLSREPPKSEPADRFLYDPRRPVPTIGGATYLPNPFANSGPRDQVAIELRDDVLVYSTSPLAAAVTILGPVRARLYVASSDESADFTAKLVDVFPDGRAMLLCDGIFRMGRRDPDGESATSEPPVLRDRVTEIEIDLTATGNVFAVGHRLRLEISSSNFPKFDRQGSTQRDTGASGQVELSPALQTVYHDSERESVLLLPVIA